MPKKLGLLLRQVSQNYNVSKKEGVIIRYSYNLIENICLVQIAQDNFDNFFYILRKLKPELINLSISFGRLNIYLKNNQLIVKDRLKREQLDYKLMENLLYIKIRFEQPDNLLYDIIEILEILSENNIPYLELGLTFNRIYLVIEDKYKEKFIDLFVSYINNGINLL